MAGTIALSDIVRFERVTRGRVRSFVTAKNYAETVMVVVALNGPDCSNGYPFFGNAGFRTRLTFVIGSLTTSSIRALSRWCNAFLQWFVMGEPFVLASRFAEISWRGRREELENGNWRPAFLPKGVS